MQFLRYQHVERFGSNDRGEVASRNRALTNATDDNHGVRAAILAVSRFRDYLAEFPNHRLFDVMAADRYLPYLDYAGNCAAFGLRVVPPIAKGTNLTAEDVAACLGEGIVIKRYDFASVVPAGRKSTVNQGR